MVRVPVNMSLVNPSLFITFPLLSNVDSGRCRFVVQNRIVYSPNDNLPEELSSYTEKSFFLCLMTRFATQFWSFAQTLCCFVCSSLCLSSSVALFSLCLRSLPRERNSRVGCGICGSVGVDDSFVVRGQGAGQNCL